MTNKIWRKILMKVFHSKEKKVIYQLDCGHSTTRNKSKDINKSGYVLCPICTSKRSKNEICN